MQVSELVAVSDPCPKDLTPYLEADFLCIKGVDIVHFHLCLPYFQCRQVLMLKFRVGLTTSGISNIIEAQKNKNHSESLNNSAICYKKIAT